MFGGPLDPPKKHKLQPWPKRLHDLHMPGGPYMFAYNARALKSDYKVRYLHYRQRLKETLQNVSKNCNKQTLDDQLFVQYFDHFEKIQFQKEIRKRAEEKIKEYDDLVEKRRKKLLDLFSEEERIYYYETVDLAQRGKESKLAEMKAKAEHMRNETEAKRQETIEKMQHLQLKEKYDPLRLVLHKLHTIETKQVNLQQMRENQSKREAEKELEQFYHKVSIKDMEEKYKREEQDAIKRSINMNETIKCWEQQIRGKKLLEQETATAKKEDYDEMMRMSKQLQDEKLNEQKMQLERKSERHDDLSKQIELSQKFLTERKHEHDSVEQSFNEQIRLEIQKEKDTKRESKQQRMREGQTYKNYLLQLVRNQKEEERIIHDILERDRKEIEKKQDAAYCKAKQAKEKLRQETMMGRMIQMNEREKKREYKIKEQQVEKEILQQSLETNRCLDEELQRRLKDRKILHQDDLLKQIEYNHLLKEREKQELEREYLQCEEEEARHAELIKQMINQKIEVGCRHPFREVLEDFECFCKEKMRSENH